MNIVDFLLIFLTAVCICLVMRSMFRRKKKGGCCGCGRCGGRNYEYKKNK